MSIYDPTGLDDPAAPPAPEVGDQSWGDPPGAPFVQDEAVACSCSDCSDSPSAEDVDPGPQFPGITPGTEGFPDATPPGFDDLDPSTVPFDPVDPATAVVDPAAVVGQPAEDAEFWLYQGEGNGTCAPTAIAMVLADVLDDPTVNNDVVLERALSLGLIEYDPALDGDPSSDSVDDWSGMDTAAMMQLCESFGLDVHASYGEVADLVEALRSDRAVMVGLDAHEIWDSADDDTSDLGGDDNHAVVVTGIDLSNGLVYLNDPGTPEGQGSVVPLGQFEDAWADSGKDMIVTDFAEDQAAASVELDTLPSDTTPQATTAGVELGVVPPTTAADTTVDLGVLATQEPRHSSLPEGAAGLVLLPFTFVARIADVVRPED